MILIAFGTRPEWIKIRPIVDAIHGEIPYKLLFTGQHTSLIDDSIENYQYEPMTISSDGCDNRLDSIVCSSLKNFPDGEYSAVMVQGDTTSAFAVALAAFHRSIPVIHLEAGLRTFNNKHPYPEEFNRASITSLADIHLCPTETAERNVKKENPHAKTYVVGNTVLDHLVGLEPSLGDFVLVTMHRRENHHNMDEWFKVINDLAKSEKFDYDGLSFVLPIHPNPNVIQHQDLLTDVTVVPAVSHDKCIDLINRCNFVITDSGGIQEESCFLRKKCIVCREFTERVEGLEDFAMLCKSPEDLKSLFYRIKREKNSLIDHACPYGDGKATPKIVEILNAFFADNTPK